MEFTRILCNLMFNVVLVIYFVGAQESSSLDAESPVHSSVIRSTTTLTRVTQSPPKTNSPHASLLGNVDPSVALIYSTTEVKTPGSTNTSTGTGTENFTISSPPVNSMTSNMPSSKEHIHVPASSAVHQGWIDHQSASPRAENTSTSIEGGGDDQRNYNTDLLEPSQTSVIQPLLSVVSASTVQWAVTRSNATAVDVESSMTIDIGNFSSSITIATSEYAPTSSSSSNYSIFPSSVILSSSVVFSASTPVDNSSDATTTSPDPCALMPCLNGGNCSADGPDYNCSCSDGWRGTNCTQADPCFPNPCSNKGVCSVAAGTGYNCTCLVDWRGTNCSEEVNPCQSLPCLNGATCTRLNATDYNCTCAPGFNGTACQSELDPCESLPCQNGGGCNKINGTAFSCQCLAGFNGTVCENDIDDCASSPCQNGGLCTDAINNYTCQCELGWMGYNCSYDVDECTTNTHKCDGHANCTNSDGNYNCTCWAGYSGDGYGCTFDDPCIPNPCVQGTCISEMFSYLCLCLQGWSGVNCSVDIDECAMNTSECHPEFGACNNTDGSYTCTCMSGHVGDGRTCSGTTGTTEVAKLYPYNATLSVLSKEKDMAGPFYVVGGLPIAGTLYHNIYVYSNGYVTVGKKYLSPNPPQDREFPMGVPLFAPYWSDIDLENSAGSVFIDIYDIQSEESDLGTSVRELVKANAQQYAEIVEYQPSYVMVVTWDKVSPFPANLTDKEESATFQAVITTNSQQSFVLFNYEKEKFSWDPKSLGRRILVGYSDGVNQTSLLSPTDTAMPWNASNIGEAGKFLYNLGAPIENNDLPCIKWYLGEMNQTEPVPRSEYGCPCTQQQAERDTRLMVSSRSSLYTCLQYRHLAAETTAHPVCCYTQQKALAVGEGSSHLLVSGVNNTAHYQMCCVDSQLCQLFYKLRPVSNCKNYQPPKIALAWGDPHFVTLDSLKYTFNGLGEYTLLSTTSFQLQGRTELVESSVNPKTGNATVLTAVAAKDNMSDSVEVRRVKKAGSNIFSDLELLINGSVNTKLSKLNTMDRLVFRGVDIQKLQRVIEIGDRGLPYDLLSVQFSSGFGFQVSINEEMLKLQSFIDVKVKTLGDTSGLLGTYDGNKNNDLMAKGGMVIGRYAPEKEVYHAMKSWQVSKNESLFLYGNREYEEINPPNFVPTFYGDMLSNISGHFPMINMSIIESTSLCGIERLKECLIDYIATENPTISKATKDIYEDFLHDAEILSLKDRILTEEMDDLLNVRGGTMYNITVYATFFRTEQKSRTSVWKVPTYSGQPLPLKKDVTDEANGLNYLYWPQVRYDQCGEYGTPDFTYLTKLGYAYSPERFYLAQCQCRAGFSGMDCSQQVDECLPNRCFTNCTASTENNKGYMCSSCPFGMAGDGLRCYEENECVTRGPCSQLCENTLGGFTCSCKQGYQLEKDNTTCSDIDECSSGGMCTGMGQYCHNTPGGFTCLCKAGFFMANDTCKDAPRKFGGHIKFKALQKDPQKKDYNFWQSEMADTKSAEFQQVASLIEQAIDVPYKTSFGQDFIGSKVITLKEGSIVGDFDLIFSDKAPVNGSVLNETFSQYLASKNCQISGPDCVVGPLIGVDVGGSTAGDKDLCLDTSDNDCDLQSTKCSSRNGKFMCSCKAGYRRWLDYTNICQDIDECTEGSSNCVANQSVCENKPGTFKCRCLEGYVEWQDTCRDICDPSPCHNGGVCSKTGGGYSCKCEGMWGGPNCDEENAEAKKYRLIAIIVGAVVGAICLILLIILIIACCRARRAKYSYSCRSQQQKNAGYYPGGEVNLTHESWGESSTLPSDRMRHTDYEMTENGSKQNLLDSSAGRTNESYLPDDDTVLPGYDRGEYSTVSDDPKLPRNAPSATAAQGVQNPAYSENGNNSNNATSAVF